MQSQQKLNKISIIYLLIAILANTGTVKADCIACPVTYDATEYSIHAIWYSLLDTITSATGLELETEENKGKAQVVNQEAITAAVQKSSEGHMMAFAGSLKQHAITEASLDNSRDFSPLSQSSFACCFESENITDGSIKKDAVLSGVYGAVSEYNNPTNKYTSDQKLITSLSMSDSDEKIKSTILFPKDNNISESELSKTAEYIILMTNPAPYPVEADTNGGTSTANIAYKTLKKIKNARLAVAQQTLSEIAANKTGSYAMEDWANQMSDSIGITSHPSLQDGKLSADAVLNLQVESRFYNPSWIVDLHRKPKAGLLRELAIMQSISLEFQRRTLSLKEKEIYMAASRTAQETNQYISPLIDSAYTLAHQEYETKQNGAIASNEK